MSLLLTDYVKKKKTTLMHSSEFLYFQVIRFEIEYFDLPPCANCGCAKVSLYDDDQFEVESLIGTYCEGGWADEFLQSGGNTAGMSYESYRLTPGTGFSIKYTFFDYSGEIS